MGGARDAGLMNRVRSNVVRTVMAGVLVVAGAACSGSTATSAPHDAGRSRTPSDPAISGEQDTRLEPAVPSPSCWSATAIATPLVTPMVNGRITSVQKHLRRDVGIYYWLAFDSASDTGLYISYGFCRDCRPRKIDVVRLTVVGPDGRVATLTCSDGPPCRAHAHGNAATLGPGADEITVESGDRTSKVIGYDGTLRRTLDLTATFVRSQDIQWVSWSPDGSRLAVLTGRGLQGSDIWLVEGDDTPQLAYSGNNPWMLRPAWSPDGRHLLVERMIPRRSRDSFRNSGADVMVFHRSPAGSSPAMTPEVLYRSNRHFDNAETLVALDTRSCRSRTCGADLVPVEETER